MPKPRKITLESATARAKLTPRKASYFVRVSPHIALGYRRNASGLGTWSVRFADGSASGWLRKFGTADDLEPADDKQVFNYDQALKQARKLTRGAPMLRPIPSAASRRSPLMARWQLTSAISNRAKAQPATPGCRARI
jgi:hypothetical protein